MGGKSDDGGGGQQDQTASNMALIQAQQQAAAQQQLQKKAAEEPVAKKEEKKEEPPVEEATMKKPEEVVPGSENLTGLGDALVGGLTAGQTQQVADQVARVGANPQTYGTPFDPYTGTFVGQGPYNTPTSGSV